MEARLIHGIPDDVGSACRVTSCTRFFHGYEMDRVSYMTALGKIHGKGKMNVDAEEIYI
jgi:hypothetical protein